MNIMWVKQEINFLILIKRRRIYMLKLLMKCAEILASGDKAYVQK